MTNTIAAQTTSHQAIGLSCGAAGAGWEAFMARRWRTDQMLVFLSFFRARSEARESRVFRFLIYKPDTGKPWMLGRFAAKHDDVV
jgi:hypothetical protein